MKKKYTIFAVLVFMLAIFFGCVHRGDGKILGNRFYLIGNNFEIEKVYRFLDKLDVLKFESKRPYLIGKDDKSEYLIVVFGGTESRDGLFFIQTQDFESLSGTHYFGKELLKGMINNNADEFKKYYGDAVYKYVLEFENLSV